MTMKSLPHCYTNFQRSFAVSLVAAPSKTPKLILIRMIFYLDDILIQLNVILTLQLSYIQREVSQCYWPPIPDLTVGSF